jgi:tetratricopeptide (TPR) repeat protein
MRRHVVLTAALLTGAALTLHPSTGVAQGVDKGCSGTVANPCGGGGGGGGNSTDSYPTIFGSRPLIDDLKDLFGGQEKREDAHPSPADLKQRQVVALQQQGKAQFRAGNLVEALRLFELSLKMCVAADDIQNLKGDVGETHANLGVLAYKRGDIEQALHHFELAEQYLPDLPHFKGHIADNTANLTTARNEIATREQAKSAQERDKAAAGHMQKAIQSFAQTLNAAPAAGGLDFDGNGSGAPPGAGGTSGGLDFTPVVAANTPATPASPPPSGDPNVVDARNVPSGLSKPVENAIAGAYANAPPGVSDRVRKGFQAVATGDWKAAKALFEDALSRDPTNAGLKRMIELSQYTLPDKQVAASTSPNAGSPPATALQLPSDDDILFPPDTAPASAVTGLPPRQSEVDEYFKNLGKGGPYKASNELRLYLNGMPREDYNRLANLSPPSASAAASTAGPVQRTGVPATYIPPGPKRDEFMMAVLMDEMMGLKPLPANEALIKAYHWDDMGRLMYRMAHEPPDPALEALMKKYLAEPE